jgi:hypothetical protein
MRIRAIFPPQIERAAEAIWKADGWKTDFATASDGDKEHYRKMARAALMEAKATDAEARVTPSYLTAIIGEAIRCHAERLMYGRGFDQYMTRWGEMRHSSRDTKDDFSAEIDGRSIPLIAQFVYDRMQGVRD